MTTAGPLDQEHRIEANSQESEIRSSWIAESRDFAPAYGGCENGAVGQELQCNDLGLQSQVSKQAEDGAYESDPNGAVTGRRSDGSDQAGRVSEFRQAPECLFVRTPAVTDPHPAPTDIRVDVRGKRGRKQQREQQRGDANGRQREPSNAGVGSVTAQHNRAVPDPDGHEQDSEQPQESGHTQGRQVSRRDHTSEVNEAGLIHTRWVVEGGRHEVLQAGQSDRRSAQQ